MKPFEISRVFDAPREQVWKSWTEAERLKKWWGPKGFVYREMVEPERLVFVDSFSDPKGGVTRHPGDASWPLEMLSTVRFEAQGGKTKVSVQWVPLDGSTDLELKTFDEGRESMKMGWTGTLDQFAAYLGEAK